MPMHYLTVVLNDDTDHGLIFNRSNRILCDHVDDSCKADLEKFDRFFFNGYENTSQREGRTPIWLEMRWFSAVEYYSGGLYWSAQVVGSLGFGDINVGNNKDAIFSIFMIILCLLCKLIISSKIIALSIYYDDQDDDKSSRISIQRAILKRMAKASKSLIDKVTQQAELQHTTLHLLEVERTHFPATMYDEMLFQTYLGFFEQLGFINLFGDGELRCLASKFKIIVIPRNELLMEHDTFVRSIYIIKEGSCKMSHRSSKDGQDMQFDYAADIENTVSYVKSIETEKGSADHLFGCGTCFGVTGKRRAELWRGDIKALQSCVIATLTLDSVQELNHSKHKQMNQILCQLFNKVEQTKVIVEKEYRRHQYFLKTSKQDGQGNHPTSIFIRNRWSWSKRQIFHPSETKINIFFLITSSIKILYCSWLVLYSARDSGGIQPASNRYTFETTIPILSIIMT